MPRSVIDYLSIEQARRQRGLRIVCTRGAPNPWCLSARYLFELKGLKHQLAAQNTNSDNPDLFDWSGQNSAPVVAYNEERLLTNTEGIVLLAERLAADRALIPSQPELRVQMFGLLRELTGEQGFAWCRRLTVLALARHGSDTPSDYMQQLCDKYGYSETAAVAAEARTVEVLQLFSRQLQRQGEAGSRYLIGEQLTALDVYAAVFFAVMIKPLPDEQIPMPPGIRMGWELPSETLDTACDDFILSHRELMFSEFLVLPMRF